MIRISEELLAYIRAEGEKSYPDECCGILFGRIEEDQTKVAERIEPICNSFAQEEQYHRFLISPETMLRAELSARKNREDIVGFYHSHPDCPAQASEYDRAHALPVYSYIITSVREGRAAETNSFELFYEKEDSRFFVEEIKII